MPSPTHVPTEPTVDALSLHRRCRPSYLPYIARFSRFATRSWRIQISHSNKLRFTFIHSTANLTTSSPRILRSHCHPERQLSHLSNEPLTKCMPSPADAYNCCQLRSSTALNCNYFSLGANTNSTTIGRWSLASRTPEPSWMRPTPPFTAENNPGDTRTWSTRE